MASPDVPRARVQAATAMIIGTRKESSAMPSAQFKRSSSRGKWGRYFPMLPMTANTPVEPSGLTGEDGMICVPVGPVGPGGGEPGGGEPGGGEPGGGEPGGGAF